MSDTRVNIERWSYDSRVGEVRDQVGAHVCYARNPNDGALIAATPDMKAGLRALLDAIAVWQTTGTPDYGLLNKALEVANAAEAKAEGR